MTSVDTAAATLESLSHQVADLSREVASLTALVSGEIRRSAQAREPWQELVTDLTPIASGVMATATRELDELDISLADLAALTRDLAANLPTLRAMVAQLESAASLMHEVVPLAGPAMESLTRRLAILDERGYFELAEGAMGVADRVVTSFTREDVDALGDNVVTILSAVKEMTQPEIMGMLQRTAVTIQDVEDTHTEPPSMFALARQLRDPETRRGLARALAMLHTLGEEHPQRPPAPLGTTRQSAQRQGASKKR